MDKLEHIYQLDKLLRKRKVPMAAPELQARLGISRATLTRLIKHCRNTLDMPITYDNERKGYCYIDEDKTSFQLPGFWFNANELLGLMTSHRLLSEVQPGILQPYLAPLQEKLEKILAHKQLGSQEIFKRIRILPIANRVAKLEDFQKVAAALVKRHQLRLQYSSRSDDQLTERQVSPQRLIYYRDNWYLDAWCHLRQQLRTFSLDRMHVVSTGEVAKDISDQALDQHVRGTYGIFAGAVTQQAVIHFSSDVARWVADEQWHPNQQSRHLQDGQWELVVPYGNPTELIRDILKFGPDAEVIAPLELRKAVQEKLSKALRKYRNIVSKP
jgi:proteasome accessory factor C